MSEPQCGCLGSVHEEDCALYKPIYPSASITHVDLGKLKDSLYADIARLSCARSKEASIMEAVLRQRVDDSQVEKRRDFKWRGPEIYPNGLVDTLEMPYHYVDCLETCHDKLWPRLGVLVISRLGYTPADEVAFRLVLERLVVLECQNEGDTYFYLACCPDWPPATVLEMKLKKFQSWTAVINFNGNVVTLKEWQTYDGYTKTIPIVY